MAETKKYPEEGELVLCTVSNIQYHSVFCTLDEYNLKGMIHISEIAPGRIKNINDYVKEGKTIVCKILRIDKAKGHIDLSIRRVTEAQRRAKSTQRKQEQIVNNIIEQVAHTTKHSKEEILKALQGALVDDYGSVFLGLQEMIESDKSLTSAGVDKELARIIDDAARDRIKPRKVNIRGELTLVSFDSRGVDVIRKALTKVGDKHKISYKGGGKYDIQVQASDYKIAEEELKKIISHVKSVNNNGFTSFERTDKK